MICFLTSNPFLGEDNGLNPANGFEAALTASLPKRPVRAVFVASSPDAPDVNDFYAAQQRDRFRAAGIAFEAFRILDRRTEKQAAASIACTPLRTMRSSSGRKP